AGAPGSKSGSSGTRRGSHSSPSPTWPRFAGGRPSRTTNSSTGTRSSSSIARNSSRRRYNSTARARRRPTPRPGGTVSSPGVRGTTMIRHHLFRLITAAVILAITAAVADGQPKPIPRLGPTGEIQNLHTGFRFTEGPGVDAEGNVYFSDIPNKKIHKIDTAGKLSVFRENSNSANGLMVNAKGEIVACEMEGAIVALSPDGKNRRVIAGEFEGKRFNAPNDLVIDKAGGVYFTDPQFRAPTPLPQGQTCVYYADAANKVTRIIDDLPNPNGVRLSPDEKMLYVFPTGQKQMMSYPVEAPGKIGKGKVFCELDQAKEGGNSGGDGGTIDSKGNV